MNKRPPRNGEKIEEKLNTLLVDGNGLFKTGYFAAKNEYNDKGVHVGGILSFLNILRMLLLTDLYHRVFVFWDGDFSGKLRYEFYKPYKSGRGKDYVNGTSPTDENEWRQRIIVQEYLEDLFVRQLSDEVIESDDFIAHYCLNKKPNETITICTNDRDFCQLLSDGIRIYFLDLKVYVDSSNFSQYFCYHKDNSLLLKTVIGDVSDTIKGVKGLGEDTLLKLFPEIKERKITLDELINKAKELQQVRLDNKQKPLLALNNIIHGITDGVQGDKLYEVNNKLVNLKQPLLTENGINEITQLTDGFLSEDGRSLKNIFEKLKRDGIDKILGQQRYDDFLLPFKRLKEREMKINNNND